MKPEQATEYLLGLNSRGIKLDLDRMRHALRDLGHPERDYPVVLVTGTNGKGSTASALASILRASGQRTGFFSSPHLVDYRERIRIDGRMISPESLAEEVTRWREVWERYELTFFEVGVALSLTAFRDAAVDVAVLEIGLGGRLDATNTTEPCLSVVASVGYDHVHILGDTLEQIAREKAGIFRPGVPALVQDGYAAAVRTLREQASRIGAPCHSRRDLVQVRGIEPAGDLRMRFRLAPRAGMGELLELPEDGLSLEIGAWGKYQVANATLAALAARLPGGLMRRPSWDDVARGLSVWKWPGRLDRPDPNLPLLFDAGHNRQAGEVLATALKDYLGGRPLDLVVGMVAKKDHLGYLRPLRELTPRIRLSLPMTPRAATREELEAAARSAGFEFEWWDSVGSALQAALDAANRADAVNRADAPNLSNAANRGNGASAGPNPQGPLVVLAGSLFVLEEGYRHLGLVPGEQI
ncbi:MAG: bifunctional folylpolyglutamate synthase/dihydrofolate synthase [Candidatus Eisenbacteria bacterium]|nr:bifunctional folylpolyglutamate synthase/dihydrofolate synthase [Candidatus Eisenbacteria bacterium]